MGAKVGRRTWQVERVVVGPSSLGDVRVCLKV
jgi:hypothetical protein